MNSSTDAPDRHVIDRHVILVGLMGAGKSTVGLLLADGLGRPFVDTDEVVEGTAGSTACSRRPS